MSRAGMLLFCVLILGSAFAVVRAEEDASLDKSVVSEPTHKQVRTITPQVEGKPVTLNTFCLAPNGDLLCCVGETRSGAVQVYTPEGELRATYPVDFKPTAINVSPDDYLFVAGEGRLVKMTRAGKIVQRGMSPHVGDYEEFKRRSIEKARQQSELFTASMKSSIATYEKQIAKIEETPEEERTPVQKSRYRALEQQKEMMAEQLKLLEEHFAPADPEELVRQAMTITAVAVGDEDLYICCAASQGHGYEVWRTAYDFSEPKLVLKGLSGCCGQMDIQAAGDKLVVAANTKFQVEVYDREGKKLNAFGGQSRSGPEGFGSCCNPMNVRCCANGEILAAESSIGNIKRFSANGEFLGSVGKARIGGGCKHVAVGFDSSRDAYYLMNVQKNQVCVLLPIALHPGLTEDERLALEAKEGLGKKLEGSWELVTDKPREKTAARSGLTALISGLLDSGAGEPVDASSLPFEAFTIGCNGAASCSGGLYAQLAASWSWEPVAQEGSQLRFTFLNDGVEFFEVTAEFMSDDEIKVSDSYRMFNGKRFRRATAVAAQGGTSEADAPAPSEANSVTPRTIEVID